MLAQLAQQSANRNGLRPINPLRDLGRTADLIESVFSEQAPFTGAEVIAEMRRWAARAPLLLLLGPLDSLVAGFVWERDGQIVGNVNVSRLVMGGGDWLISNVAVHRDHRRHGIARQLVSAALDYVAAQHGESAVLQVRQDNEGAKKLYQELGFAAFSSTIELQRMPVTDPTCPPEIASARDYRGSDRRAARALFESLLSPELLPFKPMLLNGAKMARGNRWENWLSDLVDNRRTSRLVVAHGRRVVGFVGAQARRGAGVYHRLFVAVHPSMCGAMEHELVQYGVSWLDQHPTVPTLTGVLARHVEMHRALRAWGFEEIRRLDQMRARIRGKR